MIEGVLLEDAKKIITYQDKEKTIENGFLIELAKDGEKTLSYLTTIKPGRFKGYHLHRIRKANYVCIRGKVKIILYDIRNKLKQELILDANKPDRLHIPTYTATGLENICDEEVWLVNFPNPPYEPRHIEIREQVEYTKEQLEELIK